MDPTTHGTGKLTRYGQFRLSNFIGPQKGATNFFPLGTNTAIGQAPPNYSPLDRRLLGELIEFRGERVDGPDFGVGWVPVDSPGMGITFGYAGSGKGGLIIPALLSYGGSIVANDPKGEEEWITAEARRRMGHKVANCDPFGEVTLGYAGKIGQTEPAMRYNPLAGLSPDMPDFETRVGTVAEALALDKDERGTIFTGTGRAMIEGVIAAEATMSPGKALLRNVRYWLTLSDEDFQAAVVGFLEGHPTGFAADKLRGFKEMVGHKTNQSTKITAAEQTKFLDIEAIKRYFEPEDGEPTFSFDELTSGQLSVYVVLPGRLLGVCAGFSRLMFNQALEAVQRVREENLKLPVAFLMDEAGTSIGRMDSIKQAYGLARGAGMLLWSFYQDISQLKADYPSDWSTFIGNSSCVTVTGARDEETTEYFSKWLGEETIQVVSASQGQSGGNSSSGTTTASTGRRVMTADEIRRMDPQQMLVLMPSTTHTVNRRQYKLEYFKDPRFNGLYRPDPKYGPGKDAPAYSVGPFSAPTGAPPDANAKQPMGLLGRVMVFMGVGVIVQPLLFAIHMWFLGLAALIWSIWFLVKGGPKPQPVGVWWIHRSEDGQVGRIWGIPR